MHIFACRCFAITALSALELTQQLPASAEQLVKFDSAAPRLHQAQEQHNRNGADLPPSKVHIQGYLTKPIGDGPFPVVVLLHSCLGIPANRRSLASVFAGWGYVVLFVDNFTTRGIKETCAVDFSEGLSDAFGALIYLSGVPYVDPTRIAAVGYSQGGDAALKIASSRFASAYVVPDGLKFKVAAAFYPPCENEITTKPEIPTLILIGELDNVTPKADCELLARKHPGDRPDVKLVVYPGAYHGFDNPSFADGIRLLGMWLKYDRNAAEQSSSELRDFLTTKLSR